MGDNERNIYPGEVQNGVGLHLIGAFRGGTQGDDGNEDSPLRDISDRTLAAPVLIFAIYKTQGDAGPVSNVNVYTLPPDGEGVDDARNRNNPANATNVVDLGESGRQFDTFEVHGGQDFGEGSGTLAIGGADDRVLVSIVGRDWVFEMDEVIAVADMGDSPLNLINIDAGARSAIVGQRAELDDIEGRLSNLAQKFNQRDTDDEATERGVDTSIPSDGGRTSSSGGRMILEGALKLLGR
jgi:hypothetical protein